MIATKAGLVRPGPGQWVPDGRPEHLRAACEGSLRRLKLEQIPLYQFHRPDPAVPLEESVGVFAALREEGKVRHVGLSNVTTPELDRALQVTPIASVQNRYNVADRDSDPFVERCEREQLAFIPWAPVQDVDRNRAVREAAERHRVAAMQVVLAWLLARSPVMVPIPGTGSMAHLEENMAATSLELSPEEVDALSARP